MSYCIYLRKSRKDAEAEQRGEGETLARHEHILLDLAKKMQLNITQIYREIVSGESIAARPVMQQLLSEVEQGNWDGVLVVEVERLARGDSIDQGIVAQAFKFSDTKIITPMKTYDPNNEFDEEYFEFGLFMSRREYKTINRRLQRGREAAAREGKFVSSTAPYGYKRKKLEHDKGWTLEIVPEQAEVVRLIFDLYTGAERLGIQAIARKLNQMQIPPTRFEYWQKETIRDMLDNPTYAGKIRWGYRKKTVTQVDGKTKVSYPINTSGDYIIAKGLHDAIISEQTYDLAQKYLGDIPPAPLNYKSELKNPLAGLIICGKCGRSMVFRRRPTPQKKDYIVCHVRACDNVSAPFEMIEKRLLDSLETWVGQYEIECSQVTAENNDINYRVKTKALKTLKQKSETLQKQLDNLHDLLEQGVYTTDTFLKRSRILTEKIQENAQDMSALETELQESHTRKSNLDIIPKIHHLLNVYYDLPSADVKNKMLKEVLEKAVYSKSVHGSFREHSADDFELVLFPRLPK